jgi:hypothetical protein
MLMKANRNCPHCRKRTKRECFQARPAMVDLFDHLKGRAITHANGNAYDRILISDAMFRGQAGLRFGGVLIRNHANGKGEARRLYTDHYPVVAVFEVGMKQ